MLRFGVTTVLSLVSGVAYLVVCHEGFGLSEKTSALISIVLVASQNFVAFRYYVYRPREGQNNKRMLSRYILSVFVFRGLEYVGFVLLIDFFHVQYILALVSLRFVLMLMKFVVYRTTIFTERASPSSDPHS